MRRSAYLVGIAALSIVGFACSSSNNNSGNNAAKQPTSAASAASASSAGSATSAGTASAAKPSASASVAATAAADKPVRGGTLTIAVDSNMKNLDPLNSSLVVDRQIHYQLYDSLVQIGPDLKIVPDLADSWDTSDPKAIVFKLHPGIKFQDGTDFNAAAVKFNIDRILNTPTSPRKGELAVVASVDVIDAATVKFNLKSPFAPLLATLVDRSGMILSPAAIQKAGDALTTAPVLAGTGPFQFVEWKQDDHVTLEKNPNYWKMGADSKPLPYLDKLVYKIIVDENGRLNALKTGDVDAVYRPPAKDLASIKKDTSFVYKEVGGIGYSGIDLNNSAEPFNNKALREAVAYGIDRDQILQTVIFGAGQVATGPVSAPLPPFDASFKPFTRDVAKAKAKLAEGGKPTGFTFNLIITAGSPADQQFGELVKDELKDAGITVNLVPEEFTKLVDDAQKHNYQAASIGWSGRIDPDGNTWNQFHTGGGNNDNAYSSTQVDDLLDQARATYDVEKRNQLYRQANQMIAQDVAEIFTYYSVVSELHTPKVKGYVLIADSIQRYAGVWKSS